MEIVNIIDVSKEEMASYVINAVGDKFKNDPVFEDDFNYELLEEYNFNCSKETKDIMGYFEEDLKTHNFMSNGEISFAKGSFNMEELTELEIYLIYLKLTQQLENNKERLGYNTHNLSYNYDGEKAKYKVYLQK